ncbi:hypothetical protein BDV40DRAFT_267369 [Aspergillus tamarii]|uniref:Uncharacterized protein n=1 Tax=Aspergillus tamarii TaxID=41984 RepID=A0A5N6USP0_ASPTM|nr:hypothetical protein BDV40DRAFT_267369 [Aspergillus tamarii]
MVLRCRLMAVVALSSLGSCSRAPALRLERPLLDSSGDNDSTGYSWAGNESAASVFEGRVSLLIKLGDCC